MQKYITYEEPFKNEIFTKSDLKNIYEKHVNKEEYKNFEGWLIFRYG